MMNWIQQVAVQNINVQDINANSSSCYYNDEDKSRKFELISIKSFFRGIKNAYEGGKTITIFNVQGSKFKAQNSIRHKTFFKL
jgi:hypothetical protein